MNILINEDSIDDAALVIERCVAGGIDAAFTRVETEEGMRETLRDQRIDVVLSDFRLPRFSGPAALHVLRESEEETPFIIVSGAIGEEAAIQLMRDGATDYVMKGKLERLVPAIERALREVSLRLKKRAAESMLAEVEERCHATFEQAAVGIAHTSPDGTLLAANSKLAELMLTTPEAIVGTKVSDWTLAESRETNVGPMDGKPAPIVASFLGERLIRRADGTLLPVHVTDSVVRGAGGETKYLISFITDISERKAAENALREKVSLLDATLEATGEGVLVSNLAGSVTRFNPRFLMMWDLPVVLGSQVNDLFERTLTLVKNPDAIAERVGPLLFDRTRVDAGLVELTDDRIFKWRTAPQILGNAGVGRVWSFTDVSEQFRAMRELARSQDRLQNLMANLPDLLWSADSDGRVMFVGPNAEDILGFTPEELRRGTVWFDRIHPDDAAAAMAAYRKLWSEGTPFDVEYRIQHRDGRWRWHHARAINRSEWEGTPIVDGIATDITARMETELEMRRLSREREMLLESAAEGIFGTDTQGICTFVNEAALTMTGFSQNELIGSSCHDLIHHHRTDGSEYPVGECPMMDALRSRALRRATPEIIWRKDGTSFAVEYVASPILEEGELRGSVIIVTDITERLALQAKVEQSKRVESLGRVAATIAHEFNNVLMGIQPFAEIVQRVAGDDARLRGASEHIQKSVQRGKRVALEILRFARPSNADLRAIDAGALLREVANEIREVFQDRCRLAIELPAVSVPVLADREQLEQVFFNLALNARDAMGGEGVVFLNLETNVPPIIAGRQITGPEQFIRITCRDTGCGMNPETLSRIFEPLYTTKTTGTGLGLAVVHQMIEQHGGEILVESVPGQGSAFHILLRKEN